MSTATVRIPFELIISNDIRLVAPSGEYVTIANEPSTSHIKRLIDAEIDKQMSGISATISKERNKPRVMLEKDEKG